MSVPSYDTSGYEAAAKKYQQLADLYSGKKGQETATTQATKEAKASSMNAGAVARQNALNSGYSRSRAARVGQGASASSYNDAYNTAYQNSVNANDKLLQAQAKQMETEKDIANNKYSNDVNKWNSGWNAAASGLETAVNLGGLALSDETEKNITQRTDAERIKELRRKLGCEK